MKKSQLQKVVELVQIVLDDRQIWLDTPEKNEAGTPNLFGAIAIAEAMKEMEKIGFQTIENNEKELLYI